MNTHSIYCSALLFSALAFAACDTRSNTSDTGQPFSEIRWQDPITVATGPAQVGPWRMNESEFQYVDDATVALRNDGVATVVWVDNERQDVFFQRYGAENNPLLDAPVNVSRSPEIFSWLPRVAFTDDDHVYVLWEEIVFSGGSHGGEIFFARSADGGASFSEPINLSETTAGAGKGRLTRERWDNGSLDLALGNDGEVFVAWTEYEGALRFRRSTNGGKNFEEAIQVSGSDQQPARAPSLAIGQTGILYLAWTVGEDRAADIRIARSTDNGRSFESERVVQETEGHADVPGLMVDGEGRIHLVYAESPEGPLTPSRIRYLRLDQDGHAVLEPTTLSEEARGQGARAPSVRIDGNDAIYVLWEHHPDAQQRARGLGFSRSSDGGETFSQAIVIPGSQDADGAVNGSLQGQLARKLSVNDKGAIAVANSHFLPGQNSRILLIRGR